jgi:phage gp29-like protein
VIDENSRVELKEAMVAGMANGYETFHNVCNDAISFRITGLKETKKPAGLNAGDNKFQENVREDVRVHDQMTLAETCKKQIAWPFRDLNNLRGDVKFVWGGLSDADAKTFADLLYTMRQAGYQLAQESIPTANERTGLSWERAAIPAPMPEGSVLKV